MQVFFFTIYWIFLFLKRKKKKKKKKGTLEVVETGCMSIGLWPES